MMSSPNLCWRCETLLPLVDFRGEKPLLLWCAMIGFSGLVSWYTVLRTLPRFIV